jgi:predicted enzyme related to lactoylglutathione lyase
VSEEKMSRFAVWFDIPVTDMGRAIAFYERVTKQKLQRMQVGAEKETALFESDGCLFSSPEDKPSHFGSRVYFAATPSVDDWLGRVETAGGKILVPRTAIGGDRGFFAYFEDSEGNRVGLHGRA